MYQNLRVSNLRGLHEVKVEALGHVNLVSGSNGVGKSTLLEAIFLHASGGLAGNNALSVLQASRGDLAVTQDQFEDATPWDALFSDYDTTNVISLECRLDDRDVTVRLSGPSGPAQQGGSVPISAPGTVREDTRTVFVVVEEGGKGQRFANEAIVQVNTPTQSGPGIQFQSMNVQLRTEPAAGPLRNAHFLSARNRTPSHQIAERFSKLKRRNQAAHFLNSMKALDSRLVDLELLMSQGQPTLHANLGSDLLVPLPMLGSGIQWVAEIAGTIGEAKGGLVLVDELENGIHYAALPEVWRNLVRLAERNDTQLIATTHSRECVAAAYSVLREKPADFLKLLQLHRYSDGRVAASEYDTETLGGALELELEVR